MLLNVALSISVASTASVASTTTTPVVVGPIVVSATTFAVTPAVLYCLYCLYMYLYTVCTSGPGLPHVVSPKESPNTSKITHITSASPTVAAATIIAPSAVLECAFAGRGVV